MSQKQGLSPEEKVKGIQAYLESFDKRFVDFLLP